MAVLTALPTIDVYVAFNPTASSASLNTAYAQALPATGMSNTYWTNVASYVKDFQKASGRQHFLDRIEAGTLRMTLNGRDGFFWNGTVNTTGLTIAPRLPIAVTLTWSGTTYKRFFGLIDSVKEQVADYLNSDVYVEASDYLKQLSLRYMESPAFWATYINSTSATHYYTCTTTNTGIVTAASSSGGTATYTAFNNFVAGDTITITGLSIQSGSSLNLVNVVVATATSSQFTVTSGVPAGSNVASGTGSAYRSRMVDSIGGSSYNALYKGTVSFPNNGAIIYVNSGCVDLGTGSTKASGFIQFPTALTGTFGGIDFWALGQGIGNTLLMGAATTNISGTDYAINLLCTATGYLAATVPAFSATEVTSTVKIDDGYWHHIGFVSNASGVLQLYVDGQTFSLSAIGTTSGIKLASGIFIGNTASILGAPPMQVDEIVISSNSHLSGLVTEFQNRYVAGTLLQLPVNPGGTAVSSGDRIAHILCLAGFGTVSAGAVSLNSNLYFINNGSAWVAGTSGNGFVNVEPWYWDSPIYNSTALDLIIQICDTDVGDFFQKDDGTFAYHNQSFYGTWTWSGTSGTWAPNSYTPTGDHAWSDDNSTSYPYDGTASLSIPHDDADLWTSVRILPQAGTDQVYENTAAQAQYGYTTLEKTSTLHTTLNLALSTANYLGHLFRSPLARVESVTLRNATNNGSNNTALLNVKLGDVVSFTRTPPNASGTGIVSGNYVVERVDMAFNSQAGTLEATYTLDPYPIRS